MKKQLCEIPDCNECGARDQSIFSDLNSGELTELSSNKRGRVYNKGEMVFYAGDNPSGLFCIQQGRVKIYKVGRDGKEQIVRLAQAGDVLGYRSLISGESYAAFAVPLEEAHICHISKTTINAMLQSNYQLASRVLALLSSDLRAAEEKIVEMAQKPV